MPDLAGVAIGPIARIPTWFRIGGGADRYADVHSAADLRACLELDANALVLGRGANLLVLDGGVPQLVLRLAGPELAGIEIDRDAGALRVGAAADLQRTQIVTARAGLRGLETLAGVPASIGGAIAMNAGGAHGSTFDHLRRITAMRRDGAVVDLDPAQLGATYRDGGLGDAIVLAAEFALESDDPAAVRTDLKRVMESKRTSQPLASRSAGCVFKNPVVDGGIDGVASPGQRTSAGLLIDRAGCKGLRRGGAAVSDRHANFFVVDARSARAADVLELIHDVQRRVHECFGVRLEPEIKIWGTP
ncbi:MAG: UDP-N-acetylmuramate dehydrogenase [Planctomycetota bacterium]